MDLKEYQAFVNATARVQDRYWYSCLGLAGETGEVIELIKKVVRDGNSLVTDEIRHKLQLELGDVLWYWTRLSNELGLDVEETLLKNVDKLTDRLKNGKATG